MKEVKRMIKLLNQQLHKMSNKIFEADLGNQEARHTLLRQVYTPSGLRRRRSTLCSRR